jgi:hypothetical protein
VLHRLVAATRSKVVQRHLGLDIRCCSPKDGRCPIVVLLGPTQAPVSAKDP